MYGTMFDMELARLMSLRGLGLQEMFLKGIGRVADSEKERASSEEVAHPSGAIPFGLQKMNKFSLSAGAVNVSDSKGSASVVSAAVPPVASVAAEAASVGNISNPEGLAGVVSAAPPVVLDAAETVSATSAEPPRSFPSDFAQRISGMSEKTGSLLQKEWMPPIREGGRVSSSFGYRRDPFEGTQRFHHGIDIAAEAGAKVYPVKDGVVTFSGFRKGYGNIVEIDHGEGLVTRYAHNRANQVAVGDKVSSNTVIAEVGSTGRSTGPHLHFEVQHDGKKIHPQMIFSGISKGRG